MHLRKENESFEKARDSVRISNRLGELGKIGHIRKSKGMGFSKAGAG